MRSAIAMMVLVGLLLASAAAGYWVWQEVGDVEIGLHGWIALGLGALLTFLLGAGLMALMFFSSRRGYDERAHHAERLAGERGRPPPADEG